MFINSTFKTIKHNQDPFFAINDAANYDAENMHRWSPMQRDIAHKFKNCVSDVFPSSRVYLNYRKKYIAVKVELPTREELLTKDAELLGHSVHEMGIGVKVTKNGLIFQIR